MSTRDEQALLVAEIEPVGEDALVLSLSGEIDLSSAQLLAMKFQEVAQDGLAGVVIDATGVTFTDSTGLHALVEGKRLLHEKGIQIFLVPSEQVRRVMELVFPDPLFAKRLHTVDEALAMVNAKA